MYKLQCDSPIRYYNISRYNIIYINNMSKTVSRFEYMFLCYVQNYL